MRYCNPTTQSHIIAKTFPNCIEDFNALLLREGYTGLYPLFISNEVVLNLDVAEDLLAKSENNRAKNKSMDFAFCISDPVIVSKLIVIVEVRLNYINPNNLIKEDLEGKVNGSLSLLGNSISVLANYFFLFKENKVEEARNRLFRIRPKIPNEFFAIGLKELRDNFF